VAGVGWTPVTSVADSTGWRHAMSLEKIHEFVVMVSMIIDLALSKRGTIRSARNIGAWMAAAAPPVLTGFSAFRFFGMSSVAVAG
jgi:hypothetical protein